MHILIVEDDPDLSEKLAAILHDTTIPKLIGVRLVVPCCGGLTQIAAAAARKSGRVDLVVEEVTVSLAGDVIKTEAV